MSGIVRSTAKVKDVPGDLRVDAYLTNFSQAYRQGLDGWVSARAVTNIPVNKESDIYRTYPRGYFWRDEAEVRPLGGRPVQVNYKTGKGNYHAEEWALEHTIDDRERTNAPDDVSLDETGVILLEDKQMIRQERIWTEAVFKPGVWVYDFEGGTDFDPFNDAASDPVATIDAQRVRMRRATGKKPNVGIFGPGVMASIRSNPAMVDRVKYTQTGIITEQLLAALFSLDMVMEASAVFNDAEEGEDDDFKFIADENAFWLGYIEPGARLNSATAVARFAWTGLIPGAMNSQGGVITRGRDSSAYSDWIHSRNAFDIKVVAPDLGMYFAGAVSE